MSGRSGWTEHAPDSSTRKTGSRRSRRSGAPTRTFRRRRPRSTRMAWGGPRRESRTPSRPATRALRRGRRWRCEGRRLRSYSKHHSAYTRIRCPRLHRRGRPCRASSLVPVRLRGFPRRTVRVVEGKSLRETFQVGSARSPSHATLPSTANFSRWAATVRSANSRTRRDVLVVSRIRDRRRAFRHRREPRRARDLRGAVGGR